MNFLNEMLIMNFLNEMLKSRVIRPTAEIHNAGIVNYFKAVDFEDGLSTKAIVHSSRLFMN